MTETEIKTLLEPVIRTLLAPYGFEHAEVRAGEDHDGDPTLFVALYFGAAANMPSGEVANTVLSRAHQVLVAHGEGRFPHMDYQFPKDLETRARLRQQAREYMRV